MVGHDFLDVQEARRGGGEVGSLLRWNAELAKDDPAFEAREVGGLLGEVRMDADSM